jgi:predicted GTPase
VQSAPQQPEPLQQSQASGPQSQSTQQLAVVEQLPKPQSQPVQESPVRQPQPLTQLQAPLQVTALPEEAAKPTVNRLATTVATANRRDITVLQELKSGKEPRFRQGIGLGRFARALSGHASRGDQLLGGGESSKSNRACH